MTPTILAALGKSRTQKPAPNKLPAIMEAEAAIAQMPPADYTELLQEIEAEPNDGFRRLWKGLVLARRNEHVTACNEFAAAIHRGCNHWRIGWYIAQAAAKAGLVDVVDQSCQAVLAAEPDFWFAREFPKHARGLFAQDGHDEVIERFFRDQPSRAKVFVEVGAFDGVHYSNVRRLQKLHGWTGLCIEPVSKNFKKLVAAYEGTPVRCVRAAVGNRDGEAELNVSTYPHLPDWGSDVASLSDKEIGRWAKYHPKWVKEKVPVRRLTGLLEEAGIEQIGFLSVDAEGHDLDVLQSLDFARFSPDLIVVEYGQRREQILSFLTEKGYSLVTDNGQDLFMGQIQTAVPQPEVLPPMTIEILSEADRLRVASLLNPHLLSIVPLEKVLSICEIEPLSLLTPQRFDLCAKLIYADHRKLKLKTRWAEALYDAHILAFNGGREGDGSGKASVADFKQSFHQTLDSIAANGFSPDVSLVPVGPNDVIIDGAHRVAAGLCFGRRIATAVFDWESRAYDFPFFRARGLASGWADAIALEYCRRQPNAYVATVFPSAQGKNNEVRSILQEIGAIVYEKHVSLNRQGALHLIREIYASERWLGNWSNDFAGAPGKMEPCFQREGPVRVFVFEADDPAKVKYAKERIRNLFQIGNHSVHINDTHQETIFLAQLFLNDNSVHWLNRARPRFFERFEKHLALYRQMLADQRLNPEHFCVDGSAILAAYGLRDAQDLDFLHFGCDNLRTGNPDLSSHNSEIHHHVTTRDDIIFNPENHFYLRGLKFGSLDIIRKLKEKRWEGKDRHDVAAICRLLGQPDPEPVRKSPPRSQPFVIHFETAPSTAAAPPAQERPAQKIVGLVPARNEGSRIAFCLRALALYTDAIVYLDDFSEDDTVQVVRSLAAECRVEQILEKKSWHRDEPGDRNRLLRAGREIGGTHFIVLDADEAFTSNCAENDFLRRLILSLSPGDHIALSWIQLWRSVHWYRFDDSVWTWNSKSVIFCDDRKCSYASAFIHTPRVPANLSGRAYELPGYSHGLLHFQFVNWRNLLIKQAWYRCLERIRAPRKPSQAINALYAPSKDEAQLGLQPVPANWLSGYSFFTPSITAAPDLWREEQVQRWFKQYGRDHFRDLDIWDVEWGKTPAESATADIPAGADLETFQRKSREAEMQVAAAERQYADGDLPGALASMREVLKFAPQDIGVIASCGNLLFLTGDPAGSRWEFLKSTLLQPANVAAQVHLAVASLHLGRKDECQAALSEALRLDPAHYDALKCQADFLRQTRRFKEAAQQYFQLLQQKPDEKDLLLSLAECFAQLDDRESARMLYERLLELDPEHSAAREQLDRLQTPVPVPVPNPAASHGNDPEPLVSAIVSTCNSADFMRGCLQDLLDQTLYRDGLLEIIVVNSGSDQNESEIVREFQRKHSGIHLIETPRETIYAAWNRGIQAARGKYVTNANTDDRHRPEALEFMAQTLEGDPQADVVYGDSFVTCQPDAPWGEAAIKGRFFWPEFNARSLFDICAMGPHPLWRRDLHERHGLFDPGYRSAGDYEFWLRLAVAGCKMVHLRDVVGLYLERPESVSLSDTNLNWQESERARHCHWPATWGQRPPTAWRSCEKPVLSVEKPLRILLACDYFWPSVGGVELYAEDLGTNLRAAGCDVEVACRWMAERRALEHAGLAIHQLHGSDDSQASSAPAIEELRALFNSGAFDCVMVLSQPDNWLELVVREAKKAGTRVVFLPSINTSNIHEWRQLNTTGRIASLLRVPDEVVAVTEDGHDMKFIRQAGRIPNFIPHAVEPDADPENFRPRHGLDADRPLLVMVANFWPVKNHLELLNTMANEDGDWQLAIIGHRIGHLGDYHDAVVAAARRDPRVRLLGGLPRAEAAAAIRDADLLLVPSLGESAGPLVVLQAMCYGTPWIATPHCNAVIDEAGGVVAGVRHFPAVVRSLLSNAPFREELGRAGREHWERCFTWERTTPGFLALARGQGMKPSFRMPLELRDRTFRLRREVAVASGLKLETLQSETALPTDCPFVFSVIIPTYNRCATLMQCLEALARQTLPASQFEVFVSDDGSTDHTPTKVAHFNAPFPLHYLRQTNRGPAAARNRAIEKARGHYLLILNDDAILEPDALALHLAAQQTHAGEKVAVLGRFTFPRALTATGFGFALEHSDLLFSYSSMHAGLKYDFNCFFTCNISIERQALLQAGLFDEIFTGPAAEDIEMGYRLSQRGYRVLYEPKIVAWHHHQMTPEGFCRVHRTRGEGAVTLLLRQPQFPWYGDWRFDELPQKLEALKSQFPPLERILFLLEQFNSETGLDEAALVEKAKKMMPVLRFLQQYHALEGMLAHPRLAELIKLRAQDTKQVQKAPSKPVVSVVITCYNYERFLTEAVDSVVAQTFRDLEIIIVNDGSTDGSAALAERLKKQHEARCHFLILHTQNSGQPAAARNTGVAVARGEYILCLDADDKIAPTFLAKTVPVLQAEPEVGVVYSHIRHLGVRNDVYRCGDFQLPVLSRDNVLPYCALYRRSIWESVGGYRLNIRGYEDWDFWLSACQDGWKGRLINEPLFFYRKHGAGLLAAANPHREKLLATLVSNHPRIYAPELVEEKTRLLEKLNARPSLRVTYLINSILGVTGGNQTLLRQAEALHRHGHDVTIVTHSPKPDWFDFKVRVIHVPAGRTMAAQVPPSDVVVSTYLANTHELLSVNAPLKVYYAQGDQFVFGDATLADTPVNHRLRDLSRASYLLPGIKFVPNSHNLARAVEEMTGRKADAILPVCTDQTIFRPLQRAMNGSKLRVLVVGPDARGNATEPLLFKGMKDVLEGLRILARRHPHFTVVRMSATPPDIFSQFQCEFYQAPNEEMKTMLYGTAHILIYASHYDSCPRPPQEAMAAGCAVICTATSGAMEYCRDGENSLLVPIQSPEAIADATERLLKDHTLRARLVQGGFATARQFPREREWNEWEAMLYRFVGEAAKDNAATAEGRSATADSVGPTTVAHNDQPSPAAVQAHAHEDIEAAPGVPSIGSLDAARSLLKNTDYPGAWSAVLQAVKLRPFHPDAFLLLAEIARAAGDIPTAKACAQRASKMAPKWKLPKKFLQALPTKSKPANITWPAQPEPAAAPRLTVCVIAKDEEQFLARCLKSVQPIAQQIVVVDTGSTDRTVDLAKEHGAEVHAFAWCDDFSAARNFALSHATGDWILMLDADEELPEAQHARLLAELKSADALACRLPLVNHGQEREGVTYVPRLFRNTPQAFYHGRIHEQVFPSLVPASKRWGMELGLGTASLLHYGYQTECVKDRNKVERNLKLLRRALREQPADANLLMNLGLETVRSGDLSAGLVHYREAFRLMSAQPPADVVPELREALLTQLTCHLYKVRAHEEVAAVLSSSLAKNGGLTASLHYALGLAHFELKNCRDAAAQMEQCLAKRGRPCLSPINTDILTAAPHHCLALARVRLGDTTGAEKAFQAGLTETGRTAELRLDYARFLVQQNKPLEALRQVHATVEADAKCVAAWQLGAEIALSRPEFLEFSRDWTGEAFRLLPDQPAVLVHRAEALLLSQDLALAGQLWKRALEISPDRRALAAQIICDVAAGRPAQPIQSPAEEAAVSKEFIQWFRRLLTFEARETIQQLNERVASLRATLPTAAAILDNVVAEVRKEQPTPPAAPPAAPEPHRARNPESVP